jgi:hypothetical protein
VLAGSRRIVRETARGIVRRSQAPARHQGADNGRTAGAVSNCQESSPRRDGDDRAHPRRIPAHRQTIRTIADATKDFPAIRLIMGHVDASIDGVYCETLDDERLLAVTEHVRAWLFGGDAQRDDAGRGATGAGWPAPKATAHAPADGKGGVGLRVIGRWLCCGFRLVRRPLLHGFCAGTGLEGNGKRQFRPTANYRWPAGLPQYRSIAL